MSSTDPAELGRIRLSELPIGGKRRLLHPPFHVLVVHTETRGIVAIEDACPHSGVSLEDGCVQGHRIVCPGHGWVIDLTSGRVLAPRGIPDTNPVFAVAIEDGWVVVRARGTP